MKIPFTVEDVRSLHQFVDYSNVPDVVGRATAHLLTEYAREIGLRIIPINPDDTNHPEYVSPEFHFFESDGPTLVMVTAIHGGELILDPAFNIKIDMRPNQSTHCSAEEPERRDDSRNDRCREHRRRPEWTLSPYDSRAINELIEEIYCVVGNEFSPQPEPKPVTVGNVYFLCLSEISSAVHWVPQHLPFTPVTVQFQGPYTFRDGCSTLTDTLVSSNGNSLWVNSGKLYSKHDIRRLREDNLARMKQPQPRQEPPEFFKQFIN